MSYWDVHYTADGPRGRVDAGAVHVHEDHLLPVNVHAIANESGAGMLSEAVGSGITEECQAVSLWNSCNSTCIQLYHFLFRSFHIIVEESGKEPQESFYYSLKVINRQQGGFIVEKFEANMFESTEEVNIKLCIP